MSKETQSLDDLYFKLQTHIENITAALHLPPEEPPRGKANYIVNETRKAYCIAMAVENTLRFKPSSPSTEKV